jgi:hypothetical protein
MTLNRKVTQSTKVTERTKTHVHAEGMGLILVYKEGDELSWDVGAYQFLSAGGANPGSLDAD